METGQHAATCLQFGDWIIEPDRNRIIKNGKSRALEPRIMEILLYLCTHEGRVIGRKEILEAIWPGLFVTEDALNKAISELRKAFGDNTDSPRVIETIRKRGYRFIPKVEAVSRESAHRNSSIKDIATLQNRSALKKYSFDFHWPSALAGSISISLLWLVGLMFFAEPQVEEYITFEWVSDGDIDSTIMMYSPSDAEIDQRISELRKKLQVK